MIDGISPSDLCILNQNDAHEVAESLKELCEERISENTANDLTLSYALAFLEAVNWREIALNMLDAYATN